MSIALREPGANVSIALREPGANVSVALRERDATASIALREPGANASIALRERDATASIALREPGAKRRCIALRAGEKFISCCRRSAQPRGAPRWRSACISSPYLQMAFPAARHR